MASKDRRGAGHVTGPHYSLKLWGSPKELRQVRESECKPHFRTNARAKSQEHGTEGQCTRLREQGTVLLDAGRGTAYPGHCGSTTSRISGDSHQYLGHVVLTTLLCKADTIILKLQVGKLSLRQVSEVSKLVRGGTGNEITSPDALLERWH